jgi:2-amino-4-hydroxy-6-hydroxymethyldihydropteridine diphosphokinase
LTTALSAEVLMQQLLDIERKQGRVRWGPKGGPRILDLDLLLYGRRVCRGQDLTLPHPRLCERAFVLYPLLELDPDLTVPGLGPVKDLAARCVGQVIESMSRTKENHETVSG